MSERRSNEAAPLRDDGGSVRATVAGLGWLVVVCLATLPEM